MTNERSEKELQLVIFNLADEEYAIPIIHVYEIIKLIDITRIPGMPDFVEGVVNLRGKVTPVIDIRKRFKLEQKFDKDTFTAMAATEHREEEPSHLTILDVEICKTRCTPVFNSPCITFCPAGVYETVHDDVKPANPSNCLHCKTCQRKCPFDNIRWTVPEGGGGPRYKRM